VKTFPKHRQDGAWERPRVSGAGWLLQPAQTAWIERVSEMLQMGRHIAQFRWIARMEPALPEFRLPALTEMMSRSYDGFALNS